VVWGKSVKDTGNDELFLGWILRAILLIR